MSEKKKGYFSYEKMYLFLSRHGAVSMFNNLDPAVFVFVKIVSGTVFLCIGVTVQYKAAILLFSIFGFYLPDLALKISNKLDNEQMLSDIKSIYDVLKIQTKAGVYLTNCLSECYLAVKNKRLKIALLELNNKILAKSNIEMAIDEFNLQFSNTYIDSLCIVIRQSLQSGQAVQILEDLSGQLADIQHAISLREKARVERKIELLQLLLFIGVLAVCIYILGAELTGSLISF